MRLPEPGPGNEGKSIPTGPSLPQYLDELGVPTEVSQNPQLNLAVVGCYQHAPRACHKSIPDVDHMLGGPSSKSHSGTGAPCTDGVLSHSLHATRCKLIPESTVGTPQQ